MSSSNRAEPDMTRYARIDCNAVELSQGAPIGAVPTKCSRFIASENFG
jgi:hypothetical protein